MENETPEQREERRSRGKKARQDVEGLLPDGVETPNHHLNHITAGETDERVGTLWWSRSERFGRRVAYVFDITIEERFRRQGYATAALRLLEDMARVGDFDALSLHVFAFNERAVELYRKLGYAPTSISMSRELKSG